MSSGTSCCASSASEKTPGLRQHKHKVTTMERIKQAMERARQEREAGAGSAAPTSDAGRLPVEPDDGVAAPPQISYTQTRIVRVDPEVLRRNRVISATSDPAVVDAYRMLRTRVLQRMHENGWRTLAITSAGPNEGKTLTAVNLALS